MALMLVPGLTLQVIDIHKVVDVKEITRITQTRITQTIVAATTATGAVEIEEEKGPPLRPQYYEASQFFQSREGQNNFPSLYDATVVKRASWMPKRPVMCKETCCVESLAISLDQDARKIINTIDGKDLADLRFDHHKDYQPHLLMNYHSRPFDERLLPCLLPGTIFQLDNHMIDLDYFFDVVRPQIKVPYVLMTTFCDAPSPQQRGNEISDPLMLKWFGLNPKDDQNKIFQANKEKFVPYPLGLSYQHAQEKHIIPYIQYTNFTNPWVGSAWKNKYNLTQQPLDWDKDVFIHFGLLRDNRVRLWDLFCGRNTTKSMIHISCNNETIKVRPQQIYKDMSRYRFGISPPGNGWDCYRTYEMLLLGVIPIIQEQAPYSYELFEGLPVIQMKDLNGVKGKGEIEEAIQNWIESDTFQNTTSFDWDKLFLQHYRQQVLEAADRAKDILKDEYGREYYQGYKYSFRNPEEHKETIYCQDEGSCEVPDEKEGHSWKENPQPEVDQDWLNKWKSKPYR